MIYFLLLRPVIKAVKGDVQAHYKTVEEMERAQIDLTADEDEEPLINIPPPPVDEVLTKLRKEVMVDQVPTSYILKNWIHEG